MHIHFTYSIHTIPIPVYVTKTFFGKSFFSNEFNEIIILRVKLHSLLNIMFRLRNKLKCEKPQSTAYETSKRLTREVSLLRTEAVSVMQSLAIGHIIVEISSRN